MEPRSVVAVVLILLAALLYAACGCVVTGFLCITLLVSSAALFWSSLPKARVNPAGKAVFITGCDSGFGKDVASRLDDLGFQVFAGCLAPDGEGARSLKESASSTLHIVPINVTDDFQVVQAMQYVKQNLEENILWAVINNAGIPSICEIEWCSIQEYQTIMDVNVFGVVRVTKAFLPLLRKSEGRIINVASMSGRFSLPTYSAYSMSKKACISFSDCLRQEMKKFNISVSTIEPALYKTPIISNEMEKRNRKSWAATPKDVKDVYGEEYFEQFLKLITEQMERARTEVHEVIDLMETAVCVETPEIRYVPFWGTQVKSFVLSLLPTSVTDKLFSNVLPSLPPSSMQVQNSS